MIILRIKKNEREREEITFFLFFDFQKLNFECSDLTLGRLKWYLVEIFKFRFQISKNEANNFRIVMFFSFFNFDERRQSSKSKNENMITFEFSTIAEYKKERETSTDFYRISKFGKKSFNLFFFQILKNQSETFLY